MGAPDLPTRLDLYAVGRDYIVQRGLKLTPGIVDVEGSDANVFVGSQSFVGNACILQLADRVAALTLDGANKDDLDRYAWDRYRLTRKGATSAVGFARFFRATSSAGAGAIPIGTKLTSLTGVEYVTTTAATFGATDLEATCQVRSTSAGQDQNLGTNQLRTIVSPGLLFDPSLQVTNDLPTAHGADREDDDTFKLRIRGFWLAARRGTLSAIQFGATLVEGVVSASATEALDAEAHPARIVSLSIADGSGNASRAIGAIVDATLLEYRAGGIFVDISTSMPQIVDIVLHLTFVAGIETATLTQTIVAAILGYINSLSVNETLYLGQLRAVLTRYVQSGLIPSQGTIVEPTGDLVPQPGFTLRTRLENITLQ